MIILVIFLLLFAVWIYAEKRNLSLVARLGNGLACIVSIGLAMSFAGQIIPSYESNFHKTEMRDMELCLTHGDTQAVLRALHTYNGIAATDSTYRAAMEMRSILPYPGASVKK